MPLSDLSAMESTNEGETSSPPQPSQNVRSGDPDENDVLPSSRECSALPYSAPYHRDFGESVENPKGPDSEEPAGILDKVGEAGLLDRFWY